MSIRTKSAALGVLLLLIGVLPPIGAAVYIKNAALFWVGAAAVVAAGVVMLVRALCAASREISAARGRSEALMRAQLPSEKGRQP